MNNVPFHVLSLQQDRVEEQYDFIPKTFDDYIGQQEIKDKLHVYTTAAKMRNQALDHLLLFGPPGVGKTTLAQIMSQVMNVSIRICSGPMLERTGDLVAILSNIQARDILFIDEIHRLPTAVEEVLYTAMEQFRVDIIIGQGAGAQSVNLPLNPFTLIGATTKSGLISAPLRSRFGIIERLDFYDEASLQRIIMQSATYLGIEIDAEGALLIARAARGTPRIGKKLLRRVRDFAQVRNNNTADTALVQQALTFLGIDDQGLTTLDNLILQKMIQHFNGGPVGLNTLAALIGEDEETLESIYEPYLLRKGLLERTARGRQIPANAILYLKKKYFGQTTLLMP